MDDESEFPCCEEVSTFVGGWKVGLCGGILPCGKSLLWIPATTDLRSSNGLCCEGVDAGKEESVAVVAWVSEITKN